MPLFKLLAIAIAMGMDVFSVSMAVAAGPRTKRQTFRLSFHFGLFQFFMPLIGWLVGSSILHLVESFDHWIAFGLLAAIGGHMMWEGFKAEDERSTRDRSKGWSLVALSIATSIDALGVGLMFGVQSENIIFPAIVIGLVSVAMSLLGIFLSRRLERHFGHHMEKIGGAGLILIGVSFLFGS